jgi:5'-deoxynucleotidase YfbR-like HD superfamily hydrolase
VNYGLYNNEPVIRTFSGKWVNVFDPTPDMFCIEDIAHALSQQCRFGGHLSVFYSVAQHSVLCSRLVSVEHKLSALLHDSSEAFLLDIPRPIKNHLSNYKDIEHNLMNMLSDIFKFQYPLSNEVKETDEKMLQIEWDTFVIKSITEIEVWSVSQAKEEFIKEYYKLTTDTH